MSVKNTKGKSLKKTKHQPAVWHKCVFWVRIHMGNEISYSLTQDRTQSVTKAKGWWLIYVSKGFMMYSTLNSFVVVFVSNKNCCNTWIIYILNANLEDE
jgi:hypothetical protein